MQKLESELALLHNALRRMTEEGLTREEIGQRCGLSHARVTQLINGTLADMGGIRLRTALLMFPDLIHIGEVSSGNVTQTANGNSGSVSQVAHVHSLNGYKGRLLLALVGKGLAPEIMQKVMETIKETD